MLNPVIALVLVASFATRFANMETREDSWSEDPDWHQSLCPHKGEQPLPKHLFGTPILNSPRVLPEGEDKAEAMDDTSAEDKPFVSKDGRSYEEIVFTHFKNAASSKEEQELNARARKQKVIAQKQINRQLQALNRPQNHVAKKTTTTKVDRSSPRVVLHTRGSGSYTHLRAHGDR